MAGLQFCFFSIPVTWISGFDLKELAKQQNCSAVGQTLAWKKLPSTRWMHLWPWVPLIGLKNSYNSLRTICGMSCIKLKKMHPMCFVFYHLRGVKLYEDWWGLGKTTLPQTAYFGKVMNFLLINSWIMLAFSFCEWKFKTIDYSSELTKITIVQ